MVLSWNSFCLSLPDQSLLNSGLITVVVTKNSTFVLYFLTNTYLIPCAFFPPSCWNSISFSLKPTFFSSHLYPHHLSSLDPHILAGLIFYCIHSFLFHPASQTCLQFKVPHWLVDFFLYFLSWEYNFASWILYLKNLLWLPSSLLHVHNIFCEISRLF